MNVPEDTRPAEMIAECKRQLENSLYTSTQLYICKRHLEYFKLFFAVVPIVCSAAIGIEIFAEGNIWWAKAIVTISAVVIAAFPSIYIALDLDKRIQSVRDSATEFKNLQDRFRIATNITSQKDIAEFEQEFQVLIADMHAAREKCITPPEYTFKWAQKKINAGDYDFDADTDNQ